MSELQKAIEAKINESNRSSSAGEINFHWNESEKVWCLSGSTKDGLYWETDDVEAENIDDAKTQAILHLKLS